MSVYFGLREYARRCSAYDSGRRVYGVLSMMIPDGYSCWCEMDSIDCLTVGRRVAFYTPMYPRVAVFVLGIVFLWLGWSHGCFHKLFYP